MPPAATTSGVLVSPDLISATRARVERDGMSATARTCTVSRSALAQLLAGLRVKRGTVALVAKGIGWSEAVAVPPPPRSQSNVKSGDVAERLTPDVGDAA